MATFPRTIQPRTATTPTVPGALVSIGQRMGVQTRSFGAVGRAWVETWKDLKAGTAGVEDLLAFIEAAANLGTVFDIVHPSLPGCGIDPRGAGGGTPLVQGASQSGTSIVTDGWTPSVTNVVRAGDCIRFAGLTPLYRITADANSDGSGVATLSINPSIPTGSGPADNAAVTRSGCHIRAIIYPAPTMPTGRAGIWLRGLSVPFREAV